MATDHTDSSSSVPENPIDKLADIGSNLLHVRVAQNQHELDNYDAVTDHLERDLIIKEQEALNLLRQLKAARKFVQVLKADHSVVAGSMLKELIRSFNKASLALTVIHESVESLNKNMKQWELHEKRSNSEEQQLQNMKDASRYEFMKAVREMEITRKSIIMAEMRLNAAKKMQEAVKAVEAIAIAERSGLNSKSDDLLWKSDGGVADKKVIKRKNFDGDKTIHVHSTKVKHKNVSRHGSRRPTISISAILSRKLAFQDDQKHNVHHSNSKGDVERRLQVHRNKSGYILNGLTPTYSMV